MLFLDGIGQFLKWFFNPDRKKAVQLDTLERQINAAMLERDEALNSNDGPRALLAISALLRLREERNNLL